MTKPYLQKILTACVYDVAEETPLDPAPALSERLGNRVFLKREDLQPVFSFKIRGAYNKIAQLGAEQLERGVISASAGNHAQGVALSASRLGVKAIIVMPRTTPQIKVDAVRRRGGRVVLHGDSYDEASAHAQRLVVEKGMTYIPPYDDPDVIAGQGTVGMEILRQHQRDAHAVFVPVGGGGLIAGVAAYLKQLRPEIRIIGVEPEDAPTLHAAMKAGRRVTLEQVGLFADGVAVRQIGKEPFRIARKLVDEVVLVSTDEICAAIKDIFDDTRSIMEPAGALAVAGMKKYVEREGLAGENLIAINSGANMNFGRLAHVAERAEVGEHREAVLAVTIPERPGSFRQLCRTLGKRGVTEFNYRYADPSSAHVFAGIALSDGAEERAALVAELREQGYPVLDLTEDEMAKVHVRHMVGGRGNKVPDEIVFRFEFPERPGALLSFLTRLGTRWNISMFHYRSHGAAYGRVLVGIQVPKVQRDRFDQFLDKLGYGHAEETFNEAYRLFLS
ncbi:threonine ammonia-lyase, biosynthetic [Alkalilimnicola sp. S0819]|uniref:threonine ammonia-lyase, biosynthetic n=1 Tax=Alkalilimnicola sp. S0819 TaxID=2613922 RepID=UPI00126197D6|nr:threonine ammonia-lyase, biosynthetic [Alkalilimnicola sp. S0819]KAB7628164.1 threonine ammonia-lyase, biosynthetic [Alkalilimnicola sp. S0819]MPQ15051.1 threonine ammonia-lyase, biosynthetic [Alkalilimnicola sp. S0819]